MKKHRFLLLPIIIALVCLSAPVFAGGFQLNEHGARAMAQAGAFAARAYDPSAIFFNPAGLSYQRGFQFMAGATLIVPSYSFFGPTNLMRNDRWDMVTNIFYPPNVYITNTWTDGYLKGLGVGIGLVTPYGLGTEWEDDWIGKSVTREIQLQTFYVTPTVSYAINDMVSVGVGANIVFSSVSLRRAVPNFSPELELNLEGTGKTAFSWNAGVLVRPFEDLSFGFTYRAETQVDFEGTAEFKAAGFSTLPASLAALFPGGDVKTSMRPPATWFAGVAWSPMRNLELEFDYQGIQWSSYDKLEVDFVNDAASDPTGTVKQADASSPKNYKNVYILRFGGEYSLPDYGLKLRAGYFFDHNPVPDEHLEPLLPDADRHGLNIGIGIDLTPNITLDISYLDLIFKNRSTASTSQPDGVYLDGLYTGNAQLFGADISFRF